MPTTSELLLLADRKRPRTLQRDIGPSDLGSCRRRVGYKLAGTPPVNPSGSVVAMIGTAVHDAVAAIVPDVAGDGDLVEHEVTFAGITGHLDRYEAKTEEAIDTKTTSSRWLEHVKLHGPEHGHVWQLSFYAAALITSGINVKRIRLEYLARDTGEEYVWSKPFDQQDVKDSLTWLRVIRESELAMLPRDYEPDSVFCRNCPFGGLDGGICWENHVPGRDIRSARFVDDPDAEMWAEQLWQAREAKKAAAESETEARGALTAIVTQETVKIGDRHLRLTANNQMKFVSGPREIEIGP